MSSKDALIVELQEKIRSVANELEMCKEKIATLEELKFTVPSGGADSQDAFLAETTRVREDLVATRQALKVAKHEQEVLRKELDSKIKEWENLVVRHEQLASVNKQLGNDIYGT